MNTQTSWHITTKRTEHNLAWKMQVDNPSPRIRAALPPRIRESTATLYTHLGQGSLWIEGDCTDANHHRLIRLLLTHYI